MPTAPVDRLPRVSEPVGAPTGASVGQEAALPGRVISALASLQATTILDKKALAAAFKVKNIRTIERMAARGELPPPVMIGGRAVWMAGKVLAHIEEAMDRAARGSSRRAKPNTTT